MRSTYLNTPDRAIALNFKVGSSSLARAVIKDFQPELNSIITSPPGGGNGTAYPDGILTETKHWQGEAGKCDPRDKPITLLIVRDPIEKFRSACAEDSIEEIDAHLDWLEAHPDMPMRMHFWPQSRLLQGNQVKLYRFPDDLDALATEAGLSLPLPNIAGGHNRPKPTLTAEQEARVLAIYADDMALYDSILEVGQGFTPIVPEPEPEPVPSQVTPRQIRLALIDRGIMPSQITQMLTSIEDETLREKALVEWEKATTVRRDHPLIAQLSSALSFNEEDVDELFREARVIGD